MNINKIIVIIVSNLVCAIGSTMATIGMITIGWFFFISNDTYKYYWCGGGVILTLLGYFIFRIAYPNIQRKWSDYY